MRESREKSLVGFVYFRGCGLLGSGSWKKAVLLSIVDGCWGAALIVVESEEGEKLLVEYINRVGCCLKSFASCKTSL